MPAGTKIGQAADGDGENVRIESGDIAPTVDEHGAEYGIELVTLDARVQAQLGQQLSVYYSSLISEPVPESFILLLAKLDKSETKG